MVRRVFRLRITPERAPDVHRTIDFDGQHTLHDVHVAIQREFELDDDHLHAFYLSGKYWDQKTEVRGVVPGEYRGPTTRRPLFRLGLRKGGHFAYLFDFGDELRHRIDVVDITEVSEPLDFPTLIEAVGAAPPQYDYEHDLEPYGADDWVRIEAGDAPAARTTPKVGRNDPCPCGSGKKFKKCCAGS